MINEEKKQPEQHIIDNRKKLLEKGIIVINENFTDSLFEYAYFGILEIIRNRNIKVIQVFINSNGGDVTCLFPLYDLLIATDVPVETTVAGKAFSAGFLLSLAGDKRFAYQHSWFLIHEVANWPYYMKSSQMQLEAKRLKDINNQLKGIIKDRTKMTDTQINTYMDSNKDHWIDSKTALKAGIITKIL